MPSAIAASGASSSASPGPPRRRGRRRSPTTTAQGEHRPEVGGGERERGRARRATAPASGEPCQSIRSPAGSASGRPRTGSNSCSSRCVRGPCMHQTAAPARRRRVERAARVVGRDLVFLEQRDRVGMLRGRARRRTGGRGSTCTVTRRRAPLIFAKSIGSEHVALAARRVHRHLEVADLRLGAVDPDVGDRAADHAVRADDLHAARVRVARREREVGGHAQRHDLRLAVDGQVRHVGAHRVGRGTDAVEHRVAGRLERRARPAGRSAAREAARVDLRRRRLHDVGRARGGRSSARASTGSPARARVRRTRSSDRSRADSLRACPRGAGR